MVSRGLFSRRFLRRLWNWYFIHFFFLSYAGSAGARELISLAFLRSPRLFASFARSLYAFNLLSDVANSPCLSMPTLLNYAFPSRLPVRLTFGLRYQVSRTRRAVQGHRGFFLFLQTKFTKCKHYNYYYFLGHL